MKTLFTLLFTLILTLGYSQNLPKLSNNFCGRAIPSIGTNITVTQGYGKGYKFYFTNLNGDSVGVYNAFEQGLVNAGRSAYILRLSWALTSRIPLDYQSAYWVKVATLVDTIWTNYGDSCLIITPHSNLTILPEYHGTSIGLGQNILTTNNSTLGYKFEVRALNETFVGEYDAYQSSLLFTNRSPYIFRFNYIQYNQIQPNTWYKIRVSSFNGVEWSPWGTSVIVKTL
jgi:hypothetical protein